MKYIYGTDCGNKIQTTVTKYCSHRCNSAACKKKIKEDKIEQSDQQTRATILKDYTSWVYNNGKDFPLLFNANYSKKSSYGATLNALKSM